MRAVRVERHAEGKRVTMQLRDYQSAAVNATWASLVEKVGVEVDAWLLLNALDHLWLCGELWRRDSVVGNSIVERWVKP